MDKRVFFTNEDDDLPTKQNELNCYALYLLKPLYEFNIFEYIPKLFKIITKNGIYHFNIDILKDSSLTISEFIENNPNNSNYYLDINDEKRVLGKFERIYQGETVFFEQDEIQTFNEIKKLLKLVNFAQPEIIDFFNKTVIFSAIEIWRESFDNFIASESFQTFTIITNKHEYKCNSFGIIYSKVLFTFISQNPTENRFVYDYDDDFSEFQDIADLFNFEKIEVTNKNMNTLRIISEDLQIHNVIEDIEKSAIQIEKVYTFIDEKQREIDELYSYLYNINEITVSRVKFFIMESEWISSSEKVEELGSYFLAVIKTKLTIHEDILELLDELHLESNEENYLSKLIPSIVLQLLNSFGKNKFECLFVLKLRNKGLILQDEICNKLIETDFENHLYKKKTMNIVDCFLPDIIHLKQSEFSSIPSIPKLRFEFFVKYSNCNFYDYIKMIESGKPEDIITNYLRDDDLESFKSIIISENIDITKGIIPYNIFENDFILNNDEISFLNYAAFYGSIKCFKYLLLNHADINSLSFNCALYGGNIEIIRIIDQKVVSNQNQENKNKNQQTRIINELIPIITSHKNDLFDWYFNEKIRPNEKTQELLEKIALISCSYGNLHSLFELINNGYNLNNNLKIIYKCVKYGFYSILHIILKFLLIQINPPIYDALKACIKNGNIFFTLIQKLEQINPSIFDEMKIPILYNKIDKLNISYKNKILCNLIYLAIKNKNERLIEYILKISSNFVYPLVYAAITKDCKIVDLVLKYNRSSYSVNKISSIGSPIYIAVGDNSIPIVKRLLKLDNINPNIGLKNSLNTPLIIAIRNKYWEIAEMLIQHPKVNIFKKIRFNKDALYFAIVAKQSQIIEMILEKGSKEIYTRYAMILYEEENLKDAFDNFKIAADKGSDVSMLYLGNMLYNGEGIQVNKEEALKYYKMAADNGNKTAAIKCGEMLYNGDGIPINKKEAFLVFKSAADNENVEAMMYCGKMLYNGEETQVNKEEALKYYKMAADNGNEIAILKYGGMLYDGDGTIVNKTEAARYFTMLNNNSFRKS